MDSILVTGNGPLSGQIPIAGAKNACLTLMPATLLSEDPLTLTNAPRLSDIRTMTVLLQSLGAEVQALQDGQVLAMSSHDLTSQRAEYDIVRKMRASILVLGPLLARFGEARVSLPGGCAIGQRPVDQHIRGLRAMGATIEIEQGYIHARADRLKGARLMTDEYDKAAAYLTANPDEIFDAWANYSLHEAGALFKFAGDPGDPACGCVTMIRGGYYEAGTPDLTARIRAETRIPDDPRKLTTASLPVLAELQREIDAALGDIDR